MFHPVQDQDIMYIICIQIKQAQIHNLLRVHMIRYKLACVTVKTNNARLRTYIHRSAPHTY